MNTTQPHYQKKTYEYFCRNNRGGTAPLNCRPHLHYHLELAWIQKGRVKAYIDKEEYLLEEGDIFIAFPNRVHSFTSFDLERDENGVIANCEEYKLFIINPDSIPDFKSLLVAGNPDCPVIKCGTKDMYDTLCFLEEYIKLYKNEDTMPHLDLVIKGYLTAFFGNLIGRMSFEGLKKVDSPALQTVIDYCSINFRKNLSLDTLEEELHLSKFYISHLFGAKLNMRFNDYINVLRIGEACRFLRGSDKSIGEIGEIVGFGTQRTFNRAFYKQMGISPGEYRKQKKYSSGVSMPI